MLVTYGINFASIYIADASENLLTTQRTWDKGVFENISMNDIDSPILGRFSCRIRYDFNLYDISRQIAPGIAANVYKIYGETPPYNEVLIMSGVFERVVFAGEHAIAVDITPSSEFWAKFVPPSFTALCRYTNTSQCTFAITCAKSYAACTQNGKTSIFGGFRFIPPPGSKITFREYSTNVDGGGGGDGGGRVIIPV